MTETFHSFEAENVDSSLRDKERIDTEMALFIPMNINLNEASTWTLNQPMAMHQSDGNPSDGNQDQQFCEYSHNINNHDNALHSEERGILLENSFATVIQSK